MLSSFCANKTKEHVKAWGVEQQKETVIVFESTT